MLAAFRNLITQTQASTLLVSFIKLNTCTHLWEGLEISGWRLCRLGNAVKARRIKMYPNLWFSIFYFFFKVTVSSTDLVLCASRNDGSAVELNCSFWLHSIISTEHSRRHTDILKVVELMSNCIRQLSTIIAVSWCVCLVSVVICSSCVKRAVYWCTCCYHTTPPIFFGI